ncbi:MAG TPA: ATP-binding protein [Longimicrobium sp.]|nr:ATP-binding protein [Longimicrobium sp.]
MAPITAADLLRDLNQLDEHPRVEAKTGSELGKSALQTVCAFANEPGLGGGYLLFGVSAADTPTGRCYHATGVPNTDKLQTDLASQCTSLFNCAVRPEMWIEVVDGKPLVGAYIPESPSAQKPVYFKAQGLPRGAFRRIGSADQRCTDDDLLVFFSEQSPHTFDRSPVPDASLDEMDEVAVAEYRRERARMNPAAEELAWSDEEMLVGIGCAVRDDGRVIPTVAGVLLFGKRELLRRVFPMTRLDYIRVPGREWVEDPDRRFETVDMRDPIIRLIRRAEAAILDDLPRRFNLPQGEIQRTDVPRIPDRVVREAVVNALMHRSYRTQGPTQIIRYSNRIEIRNPGHSLKAEDRLGEPGSETRNPLIAAVLHETAFAETKGSGIRVMRRLLNEMNLAPPTFRSDRGRDEFVATFFLHNLLDDEDLAWLSHFAALNLAMDETRALVHVREAGQITNAVYRDLNGVGTLEASTHLRRLRDLKLLRQHDRGAATYYTPTERFLEPGSAGSVSQAPTSTLESDAALEEAGNLAQPGDLEKPGKLRQQPDKLGRKPGNLRESREAGTSGAKSRKLGQKPGNFRKPRKAGKLRKKPGNLAAQSGDLRSELPAELATAIARLNLWTPQPDLRRLIQRLCAWRPLSTGELAGILERSKSYLRTSYIGPMVQAGELSYINPEKPNDPGQKYRKGGVES